MAENVKHTPGPWSIIDLKNKGEHPAVMAKIGCVATVWHNDEARKRVEGNARLIAAAPDLLEALQVVEKQMATACEIAISSGWVDEESSALRVARAAIAKAMGETQ